MISETSSVPEWYDKAFPTLDAETEVAKARMEVLELVGWAYGPDAQMHVTRLLVMRLAGEEIA